MSWTPEDLIPSYESSLSSIREGQRRVKARPKEEREHDQGQLNSMASDLQYTLNWLRGGINPTMGGIQRMSQAHREFCVQDSELERLAQRVSVLTASEELSPDMQCRWNQLSLCLSTREREAFYLVRGLRYSYTQAALIMDVRVGTVKRFCLRARKKFQSIA